ncbi:MAG: hypothetical protein ACE5RJ_03455 [Nitrosopumilaceae archaeon]
MRHELRRGRNWYTVMGLLFIIMATIVLVRNVIIWSPGFVLDFFTSPEITNEKISLAMIVFGVFMIVIGFRKKYDEIK